MDTTTRTARDHWLTRPDDDPDACPYCGGVDIDLAPSHGRNDFQCQECGACFDPDTLIHP